MKDLMIVVEGKDDIRFLEYLIKEKFDIEFKDFINAEGYSNLENISNEFQKAEKAIVIFDTDTEKHPDGGVVQRRKYLLGKAEEFKIKFDLFLFPNNKDDGNLETLLESISNPKHKQVFDCLDGYTKCIKGIKSKGYDTLDNKSRIYAYLDAVTTSSNDWEDAKKNPYPFNNQYKYWDFDSDKLKPLLEFLKKHLVKKNV